MNIQSTTALSILPPPSATPSTAPAEPAAPDGTNAEPSPFAKLLQQRQNADKPAERPAERSEEQANKAQSADSTQAPPSESNALDTRKTAPTPVAATTASRASSKRAQVLTELAQTQGLEPARPTDKKDERIPDTSTATLAQGLLAPVATNMASPAARGVSTDPAEQASAANVTTPTDSTSVLPTATVTADKGIDAQPSRLSAAAPDVDPKIANQDSALTMASPATQTDTQKDPADRVRLPLEGHLTSLPNPLMTPAAGDTLKSLARLTDQDKLKPLGGVSEAGPLPALGAGPTTLLPSVSNMAPTLSIQTPVQAPEFKEALATQVSMLVRDGIQQASLQLNPAHMGPISVQISLDGTQTRVDFSADSAATRQIIEAGLPELASALRDAGLTLSGGGVSQQSAQSAQQEAAARQANPPARLRSSPDDAPLPRPVTTTVSMSPGGLDLYV